MGLLNWSVGIDVAAISDPQNADLLRTPGSKSREAVADIVGPLVVETLKDPALDGTVSEAVDDAVGPAVAAELATSPRIPKIDDVDYDAVLTIEDANNNVTARVRKSDATFQAFKFESPQIKTDEAEYDAVITFEDSNGNVAARIRKSDGVFQFFKAEFPAGLIPPTATKPTPFVMVTGSTPSRVLTIDDPATGNRKVINAGDPHDPLTTIAGEVLYQTSGAPAFYRPSDKTGGPVLPMSALTIYGDSLTSNDWLRQAIVAALPAATGGFNGGQAGQQTKQISARLRGTNILAAGVTIPATVSGVGVSFALDWLDWTGAGSPITLEAIIGGVTGTLSRAPGVGGAYTFTRTTAGSSTTVAAGAAVLLTRAAITRLQTLIVWAGRNDITFASTSAAEFSAEFDAMIASLGTYVKRMLVMGITSSIYEHNAATGAALTRYQRIVAENARRATKYGEYFVDVRRWLITNAAAIAARVGVTLTSADLTQIGQDTIPASFVKPDDTDQLHFTNAITNDIGTYLVAPFMQQKGWY
jgi:hypothetical protein